MFDIPTPPCALHNFFQSNAQGLQNAALLLGGLPWLRKVQAILDALASGAPLTRRRLADMQSVHDLLTLHYVDDLDSPEAAHFACLNPADPCVEDICLLADELDAALEGHAREAHSAFEGYAPGKASEVRV